MKPKIARSLSNLVLCLAVFVGSASLVLPDDQNLSVGFRPGHEYESQYGDHIDLLSGSLSLSVPIGPSYPLTQHFNYGLTLNYASKIWDPTAMDWNGRAGLYRNGPFGLGFNLSFGRIYRDIEISKDGDGNPQFFCDWYYVSPDGNQHLLPGDGALRSCDNYPTTLYTVDGSFFSLGGTSGLGTWNCSLATVPLYVTVRTPGGIKYTFGHYVSVRDGGGAGGAEYNCKSSIPSSTDERYREYNRDFGGWYVTLIEDTKSALITISDPNSSRVGQQARAAWVEISYEDGVTKPGFDHAVSTIRDSAGRTIDFVNECAPPPSGTGCDEISIINNPKNRNSVRTISISVPKFTGAPAVDGSARATYDFSYLFNRTITNLGNTSLNLGANLLQYFDAPQFNTNTMTCPPTCPQRYRSAFGYNTYGELESRTLPQGATFGYTYDNYFYTGGGLFGAGTQGSTRYVTQRTMNVEGSPQASWRFTREGSDGGTILTNPRMVTVLDPVNNETVHYFSASRPNPSGHTSASENDGWAPEWNDGANYRVEHYMGSGPARILVRTEVREFDSDLVAGQKTSRNTRVRRDTTVFNDYDEHHSSLSFSEWDFLGHWRLVRETADDVADTRVTRTIYLDEDPDNIVYREVSDGKRVVERTDNDFTGTLMTQSIRRGTLPGRLGTPQIKSGTPPRLVVNANDINMTRTFDTALTGNITLAEMAVGATTQYRMRFGWQNGVMSTLEFYNWVNSAYFPWKALDLTPDGNTGLPASARNTAGVPTSYQFDALGRMITATPNGTLEYPLKIEYSDVQSRAVARGPAGEVQFACSGNTSGNYTLDCDSYDALGRLVKTTRRPDAPSLGYPYRTTTYDVAGNMTFRSEWLRPGDPVVGSAFDYHEPGNTTLEDPFGRVRTITTADSNTMIARYFGRGSALTINGLMSDSSGNPYSATTNYFRDGWGRLTLVDVPRIPNGSTDNRLSGGAQAQYSYDVRDSLVGVDLISQNSAQRQVRRFEYDPFNRIILSWKPETGAVSVTGYDSLGNVMEQTDASGNKLIRTYDGAGRLLQVNRKGFNSSSTVNLRTNGYDGGGPTGCPGGTPTGPYGCSQGRLTTVLDRDEGGTNTHSLIYEYTGLNGRRSYEVNCYYSSWTTDPAILAMTYNNFGFTDTVTYPEGVAGKGGAFAVTYNYSNGYPIEVWDATQTSAPQAKATYNAASEVQDIITNGGERTLIATDSLNRPKEITIGKWDGNAWSRTDYDSGLYTYDGAGRISQMGVNRYEYDAAGRLVKAKDVLFGDVSGNPQTRVQTFGYDDYGNLLRKMTFDGAPSPATLGDDQWTLDDATAEITDPRTETNTNRIIALTQSDGQLRPFAYDPRGNLTLSDAMSAKQSYVYDSLNRIIKENAITGSTVTEIERFTYDGESHRLTKEDLSRDLTTYYVRSASGLRMSEFRNPLGINGVPEWSKHYIYLGGRLVGLRENVVPQPPAGLRATTTSTSASITLSWKANPANEGINVTTYKLYRSPQQATPQWVVVATTSALTFTDTGPTASNWYLYAVTAKDSQNREGFASNIIHVQSKDTTAPTTPSGLTATPGYRQVALSWFPRPQTEYVIGYNLYRNSVRITAVPVGQANFIDQNLSPGTYTYQVSALDTRIESALSAGVSVTVGDLVPPGPPRSVLATADCIGQSSILVSWQPNFTTDQVDHYLVYRSPAFTSQSYTPPVPPGARPAFLQTSYVDTETVPGQTYGYWVVAEDAAHNASVSSRQAMATARDAVGVVATPPAPYADSGDGQVTLRIPLPSDGATGTLINIYRKPNAFASCENYELLSSVSTLPGFCTGPQVCTTAACPSSCYGGFCGSGIACSSTSDCTGSETCKHRSVDLVDGSVMNDVAYDYVTTRLDPNGHESAFSVAALATPVGIPPSYTECVEDLGVASEPGAYYCEDTKVCSVTGDLCQLDADCPSPPTQTCTKVCFLAGTPCSTDSQCPAGDTCAYRYHFKRLVARWSSPFATQYQPLSASNTGTLGYLKGFRLYKYTPATSQTSQDNASLVPILQDTSTATGTCTTGGPCIMNSDCTNGGTCDLASPLPDPYLITSGDGRYFASENLTGNQCLVLKAVHKVYANGNWLTIESDPPSIFTPSNLVDPFTRCAKVSPTTCFDYKVSEATPDPPICPKAYQLPPIPVQPTATISPSSPKVTIAWTAPAAGVCQVKTPRGCDMSCADSSCPCPQGQVCTPCKFGEVCNLPGGWCRLADANVTTCNSDSDCTPLPSCNWGQYCDEACESRPIVGYRLYASESNTMKFHFLSAPPYTPVNQNSFEFSDLAPIIRSYNGSTSTNSFSFKVASVDSGGRVSEPSLVSNVVVPGVRTGANGIAAPASLKSIVWTVNDYIKEADLLESHLPRDMDGIKLAWRPGAAYANFAGFRLWRSATPASGYCAMLKVGPSNPAGVPVCASEIDGSPGIPAAFSDTVTTSTSFGNLQFLDKTVRQGVTYYYRVTAVLTTGQESVASDEVSALSIEHSSAPLSPPVQFRAYAGNPNSSTDGRGMYLRWCPNPTVEAVTGYRIYRSSGAAGSKGPYIPLLATPLPLACLNGATRCEIKCPTGTTAPCPVDNLQLNQSSSCTTGPGGTCKVIDLSVGGTNVNTPLADQVNFSVFYYVVTAVRGSAESGYSAENSGWSNYCPSGTGACSPRYDPDNFPDTPCGNETADLNIVPPVAPSWTGGPMEIESPYRTLGAPPMQVVPLPTPNAVPRMVYLHLDHLGSPRILTDVANTQPISVHRYLPFGEEVPLNDPQATNKLYFTGHERDPESELDYMVARYASPVWSRFGSPDPSSRSIQLHLPQSWNLYPYVSNDPIDRIDRDGRIIGWVIVGGAILAIGAYEWIHTGHNAIKAEQKGERGKQNRQQAIQAAIDEDGATAQDQWVQGQQNVAEASAELAEAGVEADANVTGTVIGLQGDALVPTDVPGAEVVEHTGDVADLAADAAAAANDINPSSFSAWFSDWFNRTYGSPYQYHGVPPGAGGGGSGGGSSAPSGQGIVYTHECWGQHPEGCK